MWASVRPLADFGRFQDNHVLNLSRRKPVVSYMREQAGYGAGRAIAAGILVATVLGFVLAFSGLPLSFALAAIIGGFLTGRIHSRSTYHGMILGGVVGGLSVVAVVLIGLVLVATGLLPLPPPSEEPDVNEAALALAEIMVLQVLGGASGGALGSRFRSRSKPRASPGRAPVQEATPTKACVQCGARIAVDADVCSACGASQKAAS